MYVCLYVRVCMYVSISIFASIVNVRYSGFTLPQEDASEMF